MNGLQPQQLRAQQQCAWSMRSSAVSNRVQHSGIRLAALSQTQNSKHSLPACSYHDHQQHSNSSPTPKLDTVSCSTSSYKISTRHHTKCAAAAGDRSQPVATSLDSNLQQLAAICDAFYRFTRPHTMLGTFVSIVSVSIMAMGSFQWTTAAVAGLVQALVPALLMNICIVGINQIYDVEIDKVNKPYLPLASGELSMQQGVAIVVGTAALSLLLGVLSGSTPLVLTLLLSLVLGVLYSIELPFMRWKRSPWLAALCILAVRAVMVQLGFFLHMQQALGISQFAVTRPLAFTMVFMLLFSVVIALFKDIPDVKGDTQAGVKTFSVRHGVPRIYWTCISLLLAAYAGGIGFAITSPEAWSRLPVALGHMAFAALLWSKSAKVNVNRKSELTGHYMFVWKLFYAEYLIIPFLR